jgi:hypothetical protein
MTTRHNLVGWIGVVLVTLAASYWAFWGVLEAFHEGWCKPTLSLRLLQVLAYLSPALVLAVLAAVAIRFPRLGAALFGPVGVVIAALMIWDGAYFGLFITATLTLVPALVGLLFFVGRPTPKRAAYALTLGLPLAIIVAFGIDPAVRVSTRYDDGDRGARLVRGNGAALVWAPAGPGWTREGLVGWEQAMRRAQHLTADGTALADTPQNVWRLPTREEVVRSLTRGGTNAGGTWDAARKRPHYSRRPDKESPLWDPYAPLIYLWTSEEADDRRAWIVVYHGGVFAKPKAVGSPSFGFRAVREMAEDPAKGGDKDS